MDTWKVEGKEDAKFLFWSWWLVVDRYGILNFGANFFENDAEQAKKRGKEKSNFVSD